MSDDVDPIAVLDQAVAGLAHTTSAFWKGLVANGVPEAHASQLAAAWLIATTGNTEDPDA